MVLNISNNTFPEMHFLVFEQVATTEAALEILQLNHLAGDHVDFLKRIDLLFRINSSARNVHPITIIREIRSVPISWDRENELHLECSEEESFRISHFDSLEVITKHSLPQSTSSHASHIFQLTQGHF